MVAKVAKALKKGKKSNLYIRFGSIGKTHRIKIVFMRDIVDGDLTKIWFCNCELYIHAKIMQILSNKPISEVFTKLSRVCMEFWGLFPDISLDGDQYIWTIINQVINQVWTKFCLNKNIFSLFI